MFQAISTPDCAAERLHPGYAGWSLGTSTTHPVTSPRPLFSLREGPNRFGLPSILEAGAWETSTSRGSARSQAPAWERLFLLGNRYSCLGTDIPAWEQIFLLRNASRHVSAPSILAPLGYEVLWLSLYPLGFPSWCLGTSTSGSIRATLANDKI